MRGQPPVRLQFRISQLPLGARLERPIAGSAVVAEPTVLLRRAVREAARHDHLPKVCQDAPDGVKAGRIDPYALPPPLAAREVIHACDDFRILVAPAQQLRGRQAVQRMLETAASVEDPIPVVAPEAAGL